MASSDGPEEEFSDERRKKLFNELEQRIGLTVPPTTWAFLWLADIECLQDWVKQSKQEFRPGATRHNLVDFERYHGVIRKWRQLKEQKDSAASTPRLVLTPRPASPQLSAPSSKSSTLKSGSLKRRIDEMEISDPKHRSKNARDLCLKRDKTHCVITRDGEIDVAHIYPISLAGHNRWDTGIDNINIWTSLRYFWTEDRVKAWHNAMFLPKGRYLDVCYNLLCLSPSAHRYHGKGYFALKPISFSRDRKCLIVKFFWLRKESRASFVNICETPSLEGCDRGPDNARLWNHDTGEPIQSGDELRFETEDPEDLPSYELLEMQWFLNRVVAISGAADIDDDYDNDDDDDDGRILLEQEQDFDMLDEWDSEDKRQSLGTEPKLSSSPPSSLAPSSSGFPKRRMLHTVTTQGSATAGAVDTELSDDQSQIY